MRPHTFAPPTGPLRTAWLALLLAVPAAAPALELSGDLTQGGLVIGHVDPEAQVLHDGEPVPVAPDGRFVLGFDRDAEAESTLRVEYGDGSIAQRTLEIEQRDYEIQRIDGLPQRQVSPSQEDLERIQREAAALREARQRTRETVELYLDEAFMWPATGRITGIFGSQRILNGEPRNPHVGLDIANEPGTPIRAPASGVVAFTHPEMFFNGTTVLLDHGHGLTSIYIHMSAIHVEPGQQVEQGEIIGEIGASGRATGPHLHWGVNWHGARIDPELLVGPMPEDS